VALTSAALVATGIASLSLWSPLSSPSGQTFFVRTDATPPPSLLPIVGEFRGSVAFLLILFWLLFVAITTGPAYAASAVVAERRSGRLDRAVAEASRAGVVARAKLLAVLVPLGMTVLVAGPASSFAWLVGGMATRDAVASVAVLLAAIVLIAAVGLLCAACATSEVAALLSSYVLLGLFVVGPLVVAGALVVAGLPELAAIVVLLDPLVALLAAHGPFLEGLLKLAPTGLPTPPLSWKPSPHLGLLHHLSLPAVPIWAIDVAAYLLLAALLVWLTGVVLEPLHPLKTWRLRRAQPAPRVAT
jgi:hypothetical protein